MNMHALGLAITGLSVVGMIVGGAMITLSVTHEPLTQLPEALGQQSVSLTAWTPVPEREANQFIREHRLRHTHIRDGKHSNRFYYGSDQSPRDVAHVKPRDGSASLWYIRTAVMPTDDAILTLGPSVFIKDDEP